VMTLWLLLMDLRIFDISVLITAGQLTGQLPIWLSKLKKIEYLTLSSNHITGSIPGWLMTLPRLFGLDLSDNHFTGELPNELCASTTLVSPKALVDNNHFE
jgi:Leucine-rich repeat (LRR) protein